ncbi:MAG: LPS export ABC transporter permease LptF [Gammaproteobacteria bacterium]|nr:LPS export ABC transporter permease LptF [Gammaproteobacteria bacterium]
MLLIALVLLVVMVSNTFVQYLSEAASGQMSLLMVLKLLALAMPRFLALILPVSLFLSILVVYGKLFAESELLILFACGMSWRKLLMTTLLPTLWIAAFVAILTLWLAPLMKTYTNQINASLQEGPSVSLLPAGEFLSLHQGAQVIYIGSQSQSNLRVSDIFIYERSTGQSPAKIIFAPRGHQWTNPNNHKNYFVLEDGYEYSFMLPALDFRISHFESYAAEVGDETAIGVTNNDIAAEGTWALFKDPSLTAKAELQWRLSIPVATVALAMMAVAICYVRPRQGRFGRLFSAVLVFIIYFNLLSMSRTWVHQGAVPSWFGMWWVHIVFMVIALLILWGRDGFLWGRRWA